MMDGVLFYFVAWTVYFAGINLSLKVSCGGCLTNFKCCEYAGKKMYVCVIERASQITHHKQTNA